MRMHLKHNLQRCLFFQALVKGKKKAKEKGKRMSYVVTESGIVQVKCLRNHKMRQCVIVIS